jgi:hypothetical protein
VVEVRFVAQPFAEGRDLRDFLTTVGADVDLMQLDVVVAWAKRSGLSRLQPHLETIHDRGGQMRLVVGIDEGGATRQGLELARVLFDSVHVFHDRSGRTFHPKVYLAAGSASARLLVGSHNATAGGVYFNYEAGVESELSLPDDEALLQSVRQYLARLYADTDLCKELTDAVFAEMLGNPRYRIGDEDARRRAATPTNEPEELDADVDLADGATPAGAAPSIFGTSAEPKRSDPGAVAATKKAAAKTVAHAAKTTAPATKAAPAKTTASATKAAPVGAPPVPSAPPAAVQKRWFKRLSASDAQHPPTAGSNVTGVLRLVQAGHAINQTNYFRHDFFAPLPWAGTPKPRGLLEQTVVPFDVVIAGASLGTHNLRVDDAAYREAGQGNHTSVLHWDSLAAALAGADHTDDYVVLERLVDGSYRLEITASDPGPAAFMP